MKKKNSPTLKEQNNSIYKTTSFFKFWIPTHLKTANTVIVKLLSKRKQSSFAWEPQLYIIYFHVVQSRGNNESEQFFRNFH